MIDDALLGTVHHLVFLTSGQCMVFDKKGDQIPDLQAEFTTEKSNVKLLKQIAENAEKVSLGKWGEWIHQMDKEDFMRVTHLYII